jgi:hypothetical protein
MASNLKSSVSAPPKPESPPERRDAIPPGWLKVGAVAGASAVLGGLAAAWFYRKALSQLREAEDKIQGPEIRPATEDDSVEDF